MGKDDAGGIITWMETDLLRRLKVLVQEILHPMAIVKQLLRVGGVPDADVMDEAEGADAAGRDTQASFHPFRRCEGKLALMQHMLQRVYVQILVALVTYEIVTVALVVTHEEVLAMRRLDVLPVSQALFNREQRWVVVHLVRDIVLLKPGKSLLDLYRRSVPLFR